MCERQAAAEDGRVAGPLDVRVQHLREHGRLRSVQVVLPPAVGNEPVRLRVSALREGYCVGLTWMKSMKLEIRSVA